MYDMDEECIVQYLTASTIVYCSCFQVSMAEDFSQHSQVWGKYCGGNSVCVCEYPPTAREDAQTPYIWMRGMQDAV
jgi:hypothetical protein